MTAREPLAIECGVHAIEDEDDTRGGVLDVIGDADSRGSFSADAGLVADLGRRRGGTRRTRVPRFEDADRLRNPIFSNRELVAAQSLDRVSRPIGDDDVNFDEPGRGAEWLLPGDAD